MWLQVREHLNYTHHLASSLVYLQLPWQLICSLYVEWSSMVIYSSYHPLKISPLHCEFKFIEDRYCFACCYISKDYLPYANMAGTGLNVDEYVRRSYKFAYSDCIEVGPLACLPEPPDPNELYSRKFNRRVLKLCYSLIPYSWYSNSLVNAKTWYQKIFHCCVHDHYL